MVVNDPIADMLTRIRNAQIAKHDTVTIPASKAKQGDCQDFAGRRLYQGL
ncbi:MAG: 30S ribosomal protein S8 [Christensenellales bacterium]